MDPAQTASRFRTTSWTLIRRAQANRDDLEELLRRYWSPVYAFLRRKGWEREHAKDLTQRFLWEVVMGRDLVGQADPERGRFRSFLLTALRRFEIDGRRRLASLAGHETPLVPDDPEGLASAEPNDSHDPATAFERQWATAVFDLAMRQTEEACREEGMTRHWRAFEARVQHPKLNGCEPIPVERLMAELGARNPQEIYDLVNTVRRKLRQALRDVVEGTVDEADVDQELAELRRWLSA
jgi:RNA polymerase sigma-70 factor (ECF subfamily)